ncbi:MAG: 50S ribosomal protein L44e [Methanotrichaceae archaeon]
MKMPKEIRIHCPFCKKHTAHVVERVRRGQASSTVRITRQKKRAQGIGNTGKFSKVPGGDKPTKRVNLRYRCKECNKAHSRKGFKVSKFDLVEA